MKIKTGDLYSNVRTNDLYEICGVLDNLIFYRFEDYQNNKEVRSFVSIQEWANKLHNENLELV